MPENLSPGSASSDPVIHQLLAQRDILVRRDNDQKADIAAAEKEISDREAQHKAIDERLAELGYQ